jgi:RNA polymerase sigma-70 factor (ECF subfamily)
MTSKTMYEASSGAPGICYPEDTELAKRARAGQSMAQRELYHRLRPSVRATFRRLLEGYEPIDDLVQDAFVEIFRSIHTYRGRSRLVTWAGRISARVAVRYVRRQVLRRGQRQSIPVPVEASESVAPDETIDHREGVRQLGALLDDLGSRDRVVLALFALDGCSIAEMAHALDITPVAAKTRLSRARRRVRDAARSDGVLASYVEAEAGGDAQGDPSEPVNSCETRLDEAGPACRR